MEFIFRSWSLELFEDNCDGRRHVQLFVYRQGKIKALESEEVFFRLMIKSQTKVDIL